MNSQNNQQFAFVIFSHLHVAGGGRETWLNNFIPELSKKVGKSSVTLFYLMPEEGSQCFSNILSEHCVIHEIRKPTLLPKFFWRSVIKFYLSSRYVQKSILKSKEAADFVIAVGSPWESLCLSVKGKSKNIVWLRSIVKNEIDDSWMRLFRSYILSLERSALQKASLIISNGVDTQAAYLNEGFSSKIIPNSIALKKFLQVPDLEVSLLRPINIAFIGRLTKVKGISDFLFSIAKFNRENPSLVSSIIFQVVGDGPLKDLVIKTKEPNVRYLGQISNERIPDFLENVTAAVCLTYSGLTSALGGGGVSNGLIEIIAAGRVPICWNTLTFTQVVDKNSAILVDEGDSAGLSKVYKDILHERYDILSFSKCARDISKKYSIEKSVEDFLMAISFEEKGL